jgi:hypothetical protein
MNDDERHTNTQSGLSLLELTVACTIAVALVLISIQMERSIESGFESADRESQDVTTAAHILDRIDGHLRRVTPSLEPPRIFDPDAPELSDGVDNDMDNEVDEPDEAYPGASELLAGQSASGIWFRSVAGIDLEASPAEVRLGPPGFVIHELDPLELPDGMDNDGDDLVDEGILILSTGGPPSIIAARVTDFEIARQGSMLSITLRLDQARPGHQGTESRAFRRTVFPRNR